MKRVLAFLLAMLMMVGTPVAVLANEAAPAEPIELVVETPAEEPVAEEQPVEEIVSEEPVAEEPVEEEPAPEETQTEQVEEEVIEEPVPEEAVLEGEWEETISFEDIELPENDLLFDAYVQMLLDESVGSYELEANFAGSRLTGLTKYFYDSVKSGVEQIANGELESTEFVNVPNGDEVWNELKWTAQDLGVANIVEGGAISQAANNAARAKFGELVNRSAIMQSLLADCPAELYWFDKTAGMSVSYSTSATPSSIWINRVIIRFTVSADYSAGDQYTVDASGVTAAKAAIANAKAIVKANESKTDVQKLVAYKDEICNLVDYNHSAVNSTTYGNPSQLVYVFDNNPATKVICEGYAKAFQYLCDLSTFEWDVKCYSVSGVMSGGTGAGRHMWNVVETNGDRWLVDITNCDKGSVGAPDKLFLVGAAASNGGSTYKFTNIGGNTVIYTYDENMQNLFCSGYPVLFTDGRLDLGDQPGGDQPGGDQPGGDQPGGEQPEEELPEVELPEIEITVADGEIALDQDYIMLKSGDTAQLTAIWNGAAGDINWSINGGMVTPGTIEGYGFTVTATAAGTAFVSATVETENGPVEAICRIDVIGKDPTAAHLAETTVTSNIYSTNYATVELIFDLPQNLNAEDSSYESSIGIESVKFVDKNTADMFGIKAVDDRTLAIIPLIDASDAADVKAIKGSYKSAVAVTLANGDDFVTPEVLSIKVDKKMPSVKATAVKLESFYRGLEVALEFTSKNGDVVAIEVDSSKASLNPNWLELDEEAMTVSLKDKYLGGKYSGKLYIKATVEGYAPVPVVVSVSAAAKAPKLKLNPTSITMSNTSAGADVKLLSGDSKVTFAAMDVTDVTMVALGSMVAKDQKTYAANANYEVIDYNAATGSIKIAVKSGKQPVAGKVQLAAVIGGDEAQLVKLPLTVKLHTKAPTVKLAKSSATLNPNLVNKEDAFSTSFVVTPANYVISPADIEKVEILNGKNPVGWELDVIYADGVLTFATNESTVPGASYKVNITLAGFDKPITMSVKTVAAAKSQIKLAIAAKGKIVTGDPSAEIIVTPKWTNYGGDVDLSEAFVVYSTMKGLYTNKNVTDCFSFVKNADDTYTIKVKNLDAMEKLHPKATINLGVENAEIGSTLVSAAKPVKLGVTLTKAKVNQSTKNITLYPNDKYSSGVVALSLKETNLPDIAYVRISETSKKPSTFKLEDLGNGMYAIGFKDNKISKAGSVKLEVFLEGNDHLNGQPNATVSVSVKLAKFKVAK